ncbi:MAG: hypothetical protein QOH62_249 [Solirubrobacteraceae bacterium]|jgi:hypothetical protein|nr:hypothetical protein [Solirubrobacteraceae bacterium]
MQVSQQGDAITPQGVREGDAAALAALCERRGGAVLAYAREVCAAADAPGVAAEALARFRAAVWVSPDADGVDPERLLLGATRHAAAACARRPAEVGAARRIMRRDHTEVCAQIPALLVARAEGLLGEADQDRLARHLDRCSSCRETEAAFRRAERAYGSATHVAPDDATIAQFLAALADAAPVAAPPEPEPEPEPEPVAVAAPEPEAPAPEQAADDLDDDDADGWSGEPLAPPEDPEIADTALAVSPVGWVVPARRRRVSPVRVVLPVVVLLAGAAAAMALAGVFNGG